MGMSVLMRALGSMVSRPRAACGSVLSAARATPLPPLLLSQCRGIQFRSRMGRGYSHRMAMMKNMVTSLIEHERIKTTRAKAMEVRRLADRMVTCAKRGDLHAHRKAAKYVKTHHCLTKLFTSAHAKTPLAHPRRRTCH